MRDNGKLLSEMLGQVNYNPEWWRYFGGLADKIEGAVVPIDKPDHFAFTRHEPVGVVAALTAWNSPLLFIAWKCAAAIAAGCTVVVKPSEFASASTLEFAGLTKEAGFPDGVFNVVTGYGQEAGSALVDHPGVAKITFTGSDATGARIYAQAARTLKRVSLELGGKSPNIVFEDCDLGAAASGAISGIFAATGQTCIAGSRLLVQNSIREEFSAPRRRAGTHRPQGRSDAGGHQYRPGHDRAAVPEDPRLYRDRQGRGRALHPGRQRRGRRHAGRSVRRADDLRRRAARHADRAGGSVRPGPVDHRLRHRGRGRAARQRHDLRAGRRRLDART